ncbi:helix-loop-helix DNA-binding domain-containing protein [Pseudoneurospora amorphoporcata]|uniref:Helix-loop-helix DNA-binding domain-containing protein n=1 Tax=Pseudoneurospora amorphoporcata TaxID=241081 RepID=A0AAN6P0Y8_9PEZI|nr:helix-loop-helix DNA-binding domain-containing protein [Pseudoneurospora amorphoporcata]
MDPNMLRHLEYFSVPNHQTVNSVDQSYTLPGSSSAQPATLWGTGTSLEAGHSGMNSTAPTTMSLDSLPQPSPATAFTGMSAHPSMTRRPSMYGSQSGMSSSRASRTREGHERKRTRLNPELSPFDEPDYWLQFDTDDNFDELSEVTEPPQQDHKGTGRAPQLSQQQQKQQQQQQSQQQEQQRRQSTAHSIATTAPTHRRTAGTLKSEEYMDDSALDNTLSEDERAMSLNLAEQLSKIDTAPPQEVPPREGLYSTPLSWERPQPGLRMDSLIGFNQQALNGAEQRRLIAIAMNPGPSMGGLGSNISLNFGNMATGFNSGFGASYGGSSMGGSQMPNPVSPPRASTSSQSRPAPQRPAQKQGSMSEKSNEKMSVADKNRKAAEEKHKAGGDRTAHNDIERKYRTNLKDKIAELREAVPALHSMSETGNVEDDGSQNSRAPKVSKGTILTKATEYIHQLERRNKQITQEHRELSRRLQAFEQLLNHTAATAYQMPAYSRTLFDPRGFC